MSYVKWWFLGGVVCFSGECILREECWKLRGWWEEELIFWIAIVRSLNIFRVIPCCLWGNWVPDKDTSLIRMTLKDLALGTSFFLTVCSVSLKSVWISNSGKENHLMLSCLQALQIASEGFSYSSYHALTLFSYYFCALLFIILDQEATVCWNSGCRTPSVHRRLLLWSSGKWQKTCPLLGNLRKSCSLVSS